MTPETPAVPPEAEVIRLAREAAGLTAQSAAEATRTHDAKGVSAAYWRDIERGYGGRRGQRVPTRASARVLAAMARVVGVVPAQLTRAGREDAARVLEEILRREVRASPPAAVPDLGAADVIPAMSPAMKKAAQRYHDEIAGALGVASAVEGVPAETLRGEQVFGQGTELARLWDYATDAGLALFPAGGYPVQARAWMVAIALVRRDERRAQGGEAAGLRAPAGKRRRGHAARVM